MSNVPDSATSLVIHRIETLIFAADEAAKPNWAFKDADIKSALVKAKASIEGKPLKVAPKDAREEAIHVLAKRLAVHSKTLLSEEISANWYLQALKFISSSIVTRREMAGHPRGYLDFLKDFIGQSGKADIESLG